VQAFFIVNHPLPQGEHQALQFQDRDMPRMT
jgi:hypothetical protein